MRVAVILLCMLGLLMIAGAVPARDGAQTAVFRSPVFVIILAGLALSCAVCVVRGRRFRSIPFVLCHAGVILIVAGAGLRLARGGKYEVSIPVTAEH